MVVALALVASAPAEAKRSRARSGSNGGLGLLGAGVGLLAGAAIAHQIAMAKRCKKVNAADIDGDTPRVCAGNPVMEKRYGTEALRRALNGERQAAGMPPDPEDCDGHHIVPKAENRSWARTSAKAARSIIENCVELDSAENGVYLPNKPDGGKCEGLYHKTLHNTEYYAEVARRLGTARDMDGCEGVKNELRAIKRGLMEGRRP